MITAIVMMAAMQLVPQQATGLKLTNVRRIRGIYGKEIKSNEVMVGGVYLLAWTIDGLKMDDEGKVSYSVERQILNSKGKALVTQKAQKKELYVSLGQGTVNSEIYSTQVGTETEPGEYVIKITVKDEAAGTSKSFEEKVKVVPMKFGIVRVHLSADPDGLVPLPPVAVAGMHYEVNFFVCGFSLDNTSNQPKFKVSVQMLEDGKPILKKVDAKTFTRAARGQKLIRFNSPLQMNRAGKFTVQLKAEDLVAKKTFTEEFDITVLPVK